METLNFVDRANLIGRFLPIAYSSGALQQDREGRPIGKFVAGSTQGLVLLPVWNAGDWKLSRRKMSIVQ